MRDDNDNIENIGDLDLQDDEEHRPASGSSVKTNILTAVIVIALALIAAGAAFYYFNRQPAAPSTPLPTAIPTPLPTPTAEPTPGPAATPTSEPQPTVEPLPDLNQSDAYLSDTLVSTDGLTELDGLLTSDEIIRKFVRAVYNLSKGNVVPQYRPVRGPNTAYRAQAIGKLVTIADPKNPGETLQTAVFKNPLDNQQRYEQHVSLLHAVDPSLLAALYQRFYPLLQQAYGELGEGPEQFHSVILQALDSFLATPEYAGEPELKLTSVQYQYLDPQLEALPGTQKLMLRMGEANRRLTLKYLAALRTALAAWSP